MAVNNNPTEWNPQPIGKEFVRPKGSFGGILGKEWVLFLLLVLPNFIFLATFTYWPLIRNFVLSTQKVNPYTKAQSYAGLDNFRWLFNDRVFKQVVSNTAIFIVCCVFFTLGLGLLVALLLNEKLKGRTAVRAMVFAPYLIAGSAVALVWSYIFNPRFGLFAMILGWFDISSPRWLEDPNWALAAVIITYVWKNMGFAAVVFLAGLQGIPKDLYEAAKLDGASAWWRFRSVTLPMLSPISFFLVVTSVLSTFQAFDLIDVMTSGGPVNSTTTLVYYVYEQGWMAQRWERAAAAAVVLFILMLTVTGMQMLWERRQVHYDGN
ncbi:MAG: sugar ABC transporter permease [Thermomicrobiales bacterium]|nr:sugar ABC transporter permease [Thermomicrobiales bacterium]